MGNTSRFSPLPATNGHNLWILDLGQPEPRLMAGRSLSRLAVLVTGQWLHRFHDRRQHTGTQNRLGPGWSVQNGLRGAVSRLGQLLVSRRRGHHLYRSSPWCRRRFRPLRGGRRRWRAQALGRNGRGRTSPKIESGTHAADLALPISCPLRLDPEYCFTRIGCLRPNRI